MTTNEGYMSRQECSELRQACPVLDKVDGKHGLVDELEALRQVQVTDMANNMKAQHDLEVRLVRIEVIIPIATTILLKLVDWLPRLFATATAATK